MSVPVLLITGPVGVGKTSVADEISLRVEQAGHRHSNMDMDALCQLFPKPPDDPYGERIRFEALKSLWLVHQRAGATAVVIAALVPSADTLSSYRDAIPDAEIVVVCLTASAHVLRARVHDRERGSDLDWNLQRSAETEATQREAWADGITVDTSVLSVSEVATQVLTLAWPHVANS